VWVYIVDAFPSPIITWSKDGRDIIFQEKKNIEKFEFTYEDRQAQLIIKNVSLPDNGLYRVTVTSKDEEKYINFLLRVRGKCSIYVQLF